MRKAGPAKGLQARATTEAAGEPLDAVRHDLAKALAAPQILLLSNAELVARLADFIALRLAAQLDYWNRFRGCRDAGEFTHIHKSFLETMMRDYGAVGTKLTAMTARQVQSAGGMYGKELPEQ